jgi:hypothetical protein
MDSIRVRFGEEQAEQREQFLEYLKRLSKERTEEELRAYRPITIAKLLAAGLTTAGVIRAYRKGHHYLAAGLGVLGMPLVQTAGEFARTYFTKPKLEEIKRDYLLRAYHQAKKMGAEKVEFPTGDVKVV